MIIHLFSRDDEESSSVTESTGMYSSSRAWPSRKMMHHYSARYFILIHCLVWLHMLDSPSHSNNAT